MADAVASCAAAEERPLSEQDVPERTSAALRAVSEAVGGAAALDALAKVAPGLALRAATDLARRALAVYPPRPSCFLDAAREAGWNRDDEGCVAEALTLCDELASALMAGNASAVAALRANAARLVERLDQLWQLIVGDADAWDYDFGAASVSVVIAAVRAFAIGNLASGEVAFRAAWLIGCAEERTLADSPATWDARCRLRELALREVVLGVVRAAGS